MIVQLSHQELRHALNLYQRQPSPALLWRRVMARMDGVERAVNEVRHVTGQILQAVQDTRQSGDGDQRLVADASKGVLYCNACVDDVERSLSHPG